MRYTRETYISKCREKHGDKYDYSEIVFHSVHDTITPVCKIHGKWSVRAYSHLHYGCPACGYIDRSKSTRHGLDVIIEMSNKTHNNKYIYPLQTTPKNDTDKIIVICHKHGEFEQGVGNHKRGSGCPLCKESHGEKIVAKILDEYSVKYERQKRFSDCRGKRNPLSFDFFIPSINTLIEYDGEIHFREWRGCKKEKYTSRLEEIQKRDAIKTEYCKNNNIPLLRVSYTMSEDDIRWELGSWLYIR